MNVGDGELLITTDPIGTPSGFRDLDLVQDVLAFNERSEVTDAGAGMVILATDGAVEVVPRGGRPRTLQEGEIGIFPEGVEVTAVEAPGGNAKRGALSSLSSALGHQTAQDGASFLACVVGPEVPPLEQPSIAPRDVPGPGAGSTNPDDSSPEEDVDVADDGGEDVEEPEPSPTPTERTTEDDFVAEPTPTPTTGTVFQTPVVLLVQEPEPTLEPEG